MQNRDTSKEPGPDHKGAGGPRESVCIVYVYLNWDIIGELKARERYELINLKQMINGLINKDRYDRDGRQISVKCKYTISNR